MSKSDVVPLIIAILLSSVTATCYARTLEVGSGEQYATPSEAINRARDGDVIRIHAGVYRNDRAKIRADNLTIKGVGGKAVLTSYGMIPNKKAIWVVKGDNVTIQNVEFRGARVRDRNGAGLRLEGQDITLRWCGFFNNENGILGGPAGSVVDIQHCEFGHNSLVARPGTHNLYIGKCKKLIFKYNYSHNARICHQLKSRAKHNVIKYNRLGDNKSGRSSYIIDLPNGGMATIVGNIIHQGSKCRNRTIVAYGEEGTGDRQNRLYFINNTVINDCTRGRPIFLNIRKLPKQFRPVVLNNIFAGKGTVTNWDNVLMKGNYTGKVQDVRFVERSQWNLRLRRQSPCVNAGVNPEKLAKEVPFNIGQHYLHPMGAEKRELENGTIDVGAYERKRQ